MLDMQAMVGRKVKMVVRSRKGERVVVARVSWAERTEKGFRFGYVPVDARECAWGVTTLRETPMPYGLQSVEAA